MTHKVGTIGEFMKWTKRLVAGDADAAKTPKSWRDRAQRREALGIEDFTEADTEKVRRAEPPAKAAGFDDELDPE